MKGNEKNDIKAATLAELAKKAAEVRRLITDERLKRQSTTVKNVRAVKSLRQKLAVILSLMRIKMLAAER